MAQRSLSVEYVPLASLRLDPPKPEYSDKQLGQLANGIRIFGFNAPILVDAPLRAVAGHGLHALQQATGESDRQC